MKNNFKFNPNTLEFIDQYLNQPVLKRKCMSCVDILHPGQTCLKFMYMKKKHYYKEMFKMHLLVTLLPTLVQKYKNLSVETILKAIKKFFIASFWLELCYSVPTFSNCALHHFSPIATKYLHLLGFFLSACCSVIDTPNRLK